LLNNRWSYTSVYEKRQFAFTVFLISSAVLLEFILLRVVRNAVVDAIRRFLDLPFRENSPVYSFFSPMPDEEFYFLLNNIASALVLWISFSVSCAALMLFLSKVMTKADHNINNKISFKFKMPENWLMLMLLGLAVMYLFSTVSIIFDIFLGSFGLEKMPVEMPAFPQTAVGVFMYFFALVISPAILEEFFCRYLILNALRKYGDGFAIAASSVFFGLLHGQTNAFFYATAMGFFLGYFAVKTKSIWFPIILHAFVNFMAMMQHLVSDSADENLSHLIISSFRLVLFALALIYIIALIIRKKDLSLTKRRDYIHFSSGRKTFVFFNAATVIFIILALVRSAGEYL
jgi:membrane protease YdiL (CAAX protease family)